MHRRELSWCAEVAMWMRVARSRIDPARISADRTVQEDLAEAFRQLPGYQSFMLGVDRATGELS
jgi:hypothetical protein